MLLLKRAEDTLQNFGKKWKKNLVSKIAEWIYITELEPTLWTLNFDLLA